MYRKALLLGVAVFGALVIVAGPASAQVGGPQKLDPERIIWECQADLIFEFDDLMNEGFIPIVQGQKMGAQPGQVAGRLALIDLKTGKAEWTCDLLENIESMHLAAKSLVAATSHELGAFSLDDGKLLWSQPITGRLDNGGDLSPYFKQIRWFGDRWTKSQGVGGAVLVEGDSVYIKVDDTVYCLDATTGEVKWHNVAGFSLSAPLAVCGDVVLAGIFADALHAFDKATGKQLWVAPPGTVSHIYVVNDALYCTVDNYVARVDTGTGQVMWSPEVGSGWIRFVFESGNRVLVRDTDKVTAIDKETGDIAWQVTTQNSCSAVGPDWVAYCPQGSTQVTCVEAADATQRWTCESGWDMAPQSLNAIGDYVVAFNSWYTSVIDPKTGALVWTQTTEGSEGFFDENTAATDGKALFFRSFGRLRGYGMGDGGVVFDIPGDFFFVQWMRYRSGALCLHYGHQKVLQALRLEPPKEDATGNKPTE